MSEITFNVRGEVMNAAGVVRTGGKAPPKQSRSQGPAHYGWRAVGYPPRRIEKARERAMSDVVDWLNLSDETRIRRVAVGKRAPTQWREEIWLAKNKPESLSKLYATRGAAEEFMGLAIKAGYERVEVVEVKREAK